MKVELKRTYTEPHDEIGFYQVLGESIANDVVVLFEKIRGLKQSKNLSKYYAH